MSSQKENSLTTDMEELANELSDELRKFVIENVSLFTAENNELRKFWLRKSKKMVLCVMAVRTMLGQVDFVRGMNLEVSLPTGSLCAERNAIGTALAANPCLKREDILMFGVVVVDLEILLKGPKPTNDSSEHTYELPPGAGTLNPLWPCGVCSEWLRKVTNKSKHEIIVLAYKDLQCKEYFTSKF